MTVTYNNTTISQFTDFELNDKLTEVICDCSIIVERDKTRKLIKRNNPLTEAELAQLAEYYSRSYNLH